MHNADPSHAVLLARIRLSLRRATGVAPDVDALVATPELAAASIARWRALGVADLDSLLDRYEQLTLGPVAARQAAMGNTVATNAGAQASGPTSRYDSLYGLEGYGSLPSGGEFLPSSSFDGRPTRLAGELVAELATVPGAAQHRRYTRGAR